MANIAASHRSWAVDIKHGQNEGQKQGPAPHPGKKEPKRRANGHAKRHGADLDESPGHYANEVEAFD
jgi:hypothetical protein